MPHDAALPSLRFAEDVTAPWRASLDASLQRQHERLRPWGPFPARVDVRVAAGEAEGLHPFTLATADATQLTLHSALLTPDNGPDAATLDRLLAHELAHVALFWRAGGRLGRQPRVPFWFREGLAELVAGGRPTPTALSAARAAMSARPTPAWLDPDDTTLSTTAATAYAVATGLFVRWFDDHGHRGLATLCERMRRGATFDAAFEAVTGQTTQGWAAGSDRAGSGRRQRLRSP